MPHDLRRIRSDLAWQCGEALGSASDAIGPLQESLDRDSTPNNDANGFAAMRLLVLARSALDPAFPKLKETGGLNAHGESLLAKESFKTAAAASSAVGVLLAFAYTTRFAMTRKKPDADRAYTLAKDLMAEQNQQYYAQSLRCGAAKCDLPVVVFGYESPGFTLDRRNTDGIVSIAATLQECGFRNELISAHIIPSLLARNSATQQRNRTVLSAARSRPGNKCVRR